MVLVESDLPLFSSHRVNLKEKKEREREWNSFLHWFARMCVYYKQTRQKPSPYPATYIRWFVLKCDKRWTNQNDTHSANITNATCIGLTLLSLICRLHSVAPTRFVAATQRCVVCLRCVVCVASLTLTHTHFASCHFISFQIIRSHFSIHLFRCAQLSLPPDAYTIHIQTTKLILSEFHFQFFPIETNQLHFFVVRDQFRIQSNCIIIFSVFLLHFFFIFAVEINFWGKK